MLETLCITKTTPRAANVGGTWAEGTIAGHSFEVLVFPAHSPASGYELGDSRISKLWLGDDAARTIVASYDRGWDLNPTTAAAKAIVDVLAAGLAETVFGA